MEKIDRFNIRVYGIIFSKNKVLLSDELIDGVKMTKFPGGGLKFGEGPEDCIKREISEELNLPCEVTEHFYTTHFFQQSFFKKEDQIISIYYIVNLLKEAKNKISEKPFNINYPENNQSFRWFEIEDNLVEELTFPIDKYVGKLLKNYTFKV